MSDGHDYKRTVMLGVPCYGGLTQGAVAGVVAASGRADTRVMKKMNGHSLLAHCFNQMWCKALNEWSANRLDYFAMIHSDVEPAPGWLDVMIDELETKSLDVLAAAVALKDPRGLTSTAVAGDDGDPWRVHCRLSMAEVHRLPETFTSEDLGGRKLLLNTGLWVCRFGDWCPRVHFEINDRIVCEGGVYAAEVDSEDWGFSRQCHRLGLRLGCTRKVPVDHRGQFTFTNVAPWGRWAFDESLAERSILDPTDEGNP